MTTRSFLLARCAALLLVATPAFAGHHGSALGVSTFPTVTPGAGWTGPTVPGDAGVLAQTGTSGQTGYDDDVIAIWDAVPYVNEPNPAVVCVLAHQISGVNAVWIGADGGTFVRASYTTNGPAGTPPTGSRWPNIALR